MNPDAPHAIAGRLGFAWQSYLLLSRDGSDGYCDGYLEVRDGLGVVLIHPVLEVTPQSKFWGGSGLVSAVTTPDCTSGSAGDRYVTYL